MTLSSAQCRAGRGLMKLTQQQLADLSGVALRTIASFERDERSPIPANLAALRRALEEAGVELIDEDNAKGPGVRIRASRPTSD